MTIQAGNSDTALASHKHGVFFSVSEDDLRRLALPETEGIYFQQNEQIALRYYVEKDFPVRIHPRAAEAQEMPSETFAERKLGTENDGK